MDRDGALRRSYLGLLNYASINSSGITIGVRGASAAIRGEKPRIRSEYLRQSREPGVGAMSKQKLVHAHNWFYQERGFRWESDLKRLNSLDYWQILQNEEGPFVGDCEDAALTIMNRLLLQGVDAGSLFTVRCATEACHPDHKFDHAILALKVGDDWFFSDNRFPQFPACTKRDLVRYTMYDCVSIDNLRGSGSPELFV
jgi:hypothetical protein